ncbi:hypothetical protein [Reichenbachiella ulvae]|uniref:Lipocalin-like domain-containing protein n=1 Tax=Reichenbachiella ulvae TaxID=2980104 RepID=A0ABT3CXP2_9BACT|nr:hypothetical protein [Reichenbachiella ulvae]MCV9388466.1 hypothetical protein [Reichenbachiella ulvae]
MKNIKNVLFAIALITLFNSCGNDDDASRAQIGNYIALEDGVIRSQCSIEDNNGVINCPRTSSTTSCVTLNLRTDGFYSLSVAVLNLSFIEGGTYEIDPGKLKLCPANQDCYTIPVIDSSFDAMTIELTNEQFPNEQGCDIEIGMEKL